MKRPSSRLTTFIIICLSLTAPLSVQAQRQPRCGAERWPVKTASDGDIDKLFVNGRLKRARRTTVEALSLHPYPFPNPASMPREWWNKRIEDNEDTETTIWMVRAVLVEYSLEDDSDYHLILEDENGNQMGAEIPHPACLPRGTPAVLRQAITTARAVFDSRFRPMRRHQEADVIIDVAGLGMFDRSHGQRGRADNGIELHPVIAIRFPRR